MIGILVFLSDAYDIRSNRESGDGRYDLMLIPKDASLMGVIIECKKATSDSQQIFEKTADEALTQVNEKIMLKS